MSNVAVATASPQLALFDDFKTSTDKASKKLSKLASDTKKLGKAVKKARQATAAPAPVKSVQWPDTLLNKRIPVPEFPPTLLNKDVDKKDMQYNLRHMN